MSTLTRNSRLVIASHNAGKIQEISELLEPYEMKVLAAPDLGCPDVEETGTTFEENALLKASAAAAHTGLPALADDSGLCIAAFDGGPGLHSARWAKEHGGLPKALDKMAELLESATNKSAYFICVLALAVPDGATQTFEARVDGQMTFPPRGKTGFGYDPVFIPDTQPAGQSLTFGEMQESEKQRLSHRAIALRQFVDACFADAATKTA